MKIEIKMGQIMVVLKKIWKKNGGKGLDKMLLENSHIIFLLIVLFDALFVFLAIKLPFFGWNILFQDWRDAMSIFPLIAGVVYYLGIRHAQPRFAAYVPAIFAIAFVVLVLAIPLKSGMIDEKCASVDCCNEPRPGCGNCKLSCHKDTSALLDAIVDRQAGLYGILAIVSFLLNRKQSI